jgi:ABC-2 type transport system permease protein
MVGRTGLGRWLTRTLAYFRKEVNEIRRQPLLILSLIGGPLLVLILFGASFQNSTPVLRTAVVLPTQGLPGVTEEQIRTLVGTNFKLELITTDRAAAEAQLRAGQLDVVQVLPDTIFEAVQRGETPQIEFLSNAVNPILEGWIQYLGYAEVNEINKAILQQQTNAAQQEAGTIVIQIGDAQIEIDSLLAEVNQERVAASRRSLAQLRDGIDTLLVQLPETGSLSGPRSEISELRRDLGELRRNLDEIIVFIDNDQIDQNRDRLQEARERMGQIESRLQIFRRTPADRIISPIQQKYTNIRGASYSAVVYYAPGVLALLVQHTAITLGALALVRERLMGAFEVFRVAPVSIAQLLIGKYLGYTLFIMLTAAVLMLGLLALGIPLLGNPLVFAGLLLLLTLASLGIGFLISTIAGTDSQAIQLAMITLLLSIFFSGFFIGLDSFASAALAVSYSIPMTHGVLGLQNVMLRGTDPGLWQWVALAIIAVLSFALVVLLTRRQIARA